MHSLVSKISDIQIQIRIRFIAINKHFKNPKKPNDYKTLDLCYLSLLKNLGLYNCMIRIIANIINF